MDIYEYFELLMYIAKRGGLFGDLKSSTTKISKEIGISQQTVSRKLREMEKEGFIKRKVSPRGISVGIDKKGQELLFEIYKKLEGLFERKEKEIFGIVKSGIGEGAYYVSKEKYQRQFEKKIGFRAFPGTLNLMVNKAKLAQLIITKKAILIKGFKTKKRSFGSLTCYKAKINNVRCAMVIPERTRHSENIIEIIAPMRLRSFLRLKDGDKVVLR